MNVLSWISTRWQHDASGYTYEMSVIVTLQDVCLWIPNPRDFCCLKLSETNTLDSVHIHRSDEKNSKPFVHVRNHTTSRYSKGTVQQFYSEYICHGIPNTKRKKKSSCTPSFSSLLRTLLSALEEKNMTYDICWCFPLSNSVQSQIFAKKAVTNTVPMEITSYLILLMQIP